MGCGGSRDGGDKEIDYAMEFIPAPDINNFFSTCEEVLKTAEELRAGWEDSLEEMYDISSVCFLKAPPNLVDAVKVWIWALAANNEGDINKCKPTVQKESPYLDCNLGKECSSCHNSTNIYHSGCAMNQLAKFKDALKEYVKTCIEGVKALPDLLKNLQDLSDQAAGMKDKAKDSLSGLGALDKAKALGKIAKNTGKLTKGISKLQNVNRLVPEAIKNMEAVIKEFQEIVKTANDVAKKAVDKKATLPADVMQICHPGEKFNEAQIKKMKEEAEKKRKEEEEQKKKKADLLAKFMEAKKALTEKK